jgi:hypothetical protein
MNENAISNKERSFEAIRRMEIDLNRRKCRWLAQHGWSYSSDFADSCWRWCKTISGRVITVASTNEAIRIEFAAP